MWRKFLIAKYATRSSWSKALYCVSARLNVFEKKAESSRERVPFIFFWRAVPALKIKRLQTSARNTLGFGLSNKVASMRSCFAFSNLPLRKTKIKSPCNFTDKFAAFHKPKVIENGSYKPNGVLSAALWTSHSAMGIWLNAQTKSIFGKICLPRSCCTKFPYNIPSIGRVLCEHQVGCRHHTDFIHRFLGSCAAEMPNCLRMGASPFVEHTVK